MDVSVFKTIIFDVARQIGAKVLDNREPDVTPNFITAMLSVDKRRFYILHSNDGNWAFCGMVDSEHCLLEFDDCPPLAEVLEKTYDIRPIAKSVLLEPFEKADGINEADVKYWQPRTLGDALFNWWD